MPRTVATVPLPELTRQWSGRLSSDDVDQVRALVAAAERADGVAPLSEHVLLHLPAGGDEAGRNLLVHVDSELAAYAHLDVTDEVEGASAELVVAPEARGRGTGRALVRTLLEHSPDGRLRLWAHGDSAPAARLAASLGFRRSRVLLQMRRPLGEEAPELPPIRMPEDVQTRTFVVGQDEQAWIGVNNRAFVDHPEQSGWGLPEVCLREQEPWFDPAGFFLAEREGRLVGFHWTKVHGGHPAYEPHPADEPGPHEPGPHEPGPHEHTPHEHEPRQHHDHPPIGEVYIVGVDPSEQGRGLGPALTLLGLHHLEQRGLREVMLYVDESNGAAVRVYERLGFTRHTVDVTYVRL